MKKKVGYVGMLSLAMAMMAVTASASPSIIQESPVPGVISSSVTPTGSDDPVITPFSVSPLFNTVLGGTNSTSTFVVSPGYGHIKVFVKNTGKSTITVSLQHRNSGRIYFTESIAPDAQPLDWKSFDRGYQQGVIGGEYIVTYRAGGNVMSGEAWGMSTTIPSDL
ncbi:hypothetical protein ACM1RC_05655 [Paenibacillus azoreducens]|uniref:hypothetical protein n=1 Tax=Paenibacillus azoreducens TaxID=116718 RepID=UPI0039F61033